MRPHSCIFLFLFLPSLSSCVILLLLLHQPRCFVRPTAEPAQIINPPDDYLVQLGRRRKGNLFPVLNQCKEFRKESYLPSSTSPMGTSPHFPCHILVSQILGQKINRVALLRGLWCTMYMCNITLKRVGDTDLIKTLVCKPHWWDKWLVAGPQKKK